MNSSDYIEVTVTMEPFTQENAEIAEAMISDLPYDSFVTEENALKCYIQKDLYDRRTLRLVLSGLQFKTDFTARAVPSQNWNSEWERTMKPIVVDGKITVKLADDTTAGKTQYNIKLRPEMAFGTGHHDTTCMMLSSMLEYRDVIRGGVVMDMGCGTAILGILAAKMGAERVYGIDIDAVAAQSAYDNARLNRVGRKVETYCGDASLLQMGKYNMLLANIHRNIIIMDLRTYARSLKKGGILLLSGFYDADVSAVLEEASQHGLTLLKQRSSDGWACLHLKK